MNRYRFLVTVMVIVVLTVTVLLTVRYFAMRATKADLSNKNVQAFLRVIRFAEGTSGVDGYRTMFGGKLFDVSNGWSHPNICVKFFNPKTNRDSCSTAAGAYQFLYRSWIAYAKKLKLKDFSPENQDLAAVQYIKDEGAFNDVVAGRFEIAVDKIQNVWASLPDHPGGEAPAGYKQPIKSMAVLLNKYKSEGGSLA